MPGYNRTGPMGQGPMTGRGKGFCGGAGAMGNGPRGGRGRRGWRHCFNATGVPGWMGSAPMPDEREELQHQAELLREQLARVEQRLKDSAPAETGK